MVAGDAGSYSAQGEAQVQGMGGKASFRSQSFHQSTERRRYQKQRWFRKGQKWRTGFEGRISILKRRHGLRRCGYKGNAGMKRWVGLGVVGDPAPEVDASSVLNRQLLNRRRTPT